MIDTALNGICPYFTMFPLEFPRGVLARHAKPGETVLDPFAGRGTTLYAGRLEGLHAYGVDSNPVAVAISAAKLSNSSPGRITAAARYILARKRTPDNVPTGEFWQLAFHPAVLDQLCCLREDLVQNCENDTRKALRAVVLGALHGPRAKTRNSYFSNQCPRTYAPKPAYAVKYWRKHNMKPVNVNVLEIIQARATRYFGQEQIDASGKIYFGDSTDPESVGQIDREVDWIVTSPPYYGMRTYLPDQWLRLWFVGGKAEVDYSNEKQLSHRSRGEFSAALGKVWQNCAAIAGDNARLVIRFGAINDRKLDPRELVKNSLADTGWRLLTSHNAGIAAAGRRQANHFGTEDFIPALAEYDLWAVKAN
jgi:hypothetical protein